MPAKVTDLTYLQENTFGNATLMQELIDVYIETTPQMISTLKKANADNDYGKLRRVAHKLKSNMHTIGMQHAVTILDNIENAGDEHLTASFVKTSVDELEEMYQQSITEL